MYKKSNSKTSAKKSQRIKSYRKNKPVYSKEISEFLQNFPDIMNMSPLRAKPRHFRQYLMEELRKGISAHCLDTHRAAIQEWYKHENKRKLLLELPKNMDSESAIRYLSPQDLDTLFRSFGVGVCATFLRLIYAAGLHLQEALALRHKDLDMKNCKLFVPAAGHKISHETIFAPALLPELQLLVDACEPEDYLFSVRRSKSDNRRKALARRTPQTFLENACKRLNISDVSTRTLRDNFAIHLLQMGVAPHKVSKLMGFRNMQSIQRYQDFISNAKLNILFPIGTHFSSKYWLKEHTGATSN